MMDLIRYVGETQVAFIERMLREHGEVSAHDLTYATWYADGSKCGITRAAGHIWTLRHRRGMDIVTTGEDDQQATYVYRGDLPDAAPVAIPWGEWTCRTCGSHPANEPTPLLGDMGSAACPTCGTRTYFRRQTA